MKEEVSLLFSTAWPKLSGQQTFQDPLVSIALLPIGVLGLHMLTLCICLFYGFWRLELRRSYTCDSSF